MAHRPPNILWIMTDEHRPDSLGCYGSAWAKTPHLDALAARGVTFTRAYCQSPVCVPSRTSQMCCRYPQEVNTLVNQACDHPDVLPPGTRMFTEVFADAGYHTVNHGKRHIASCHAPSWREHHSVITDGRYAGCWDLNEQFDEAAYHVVKRPGLEHVIIGGTYPGSVEDNPSRLITDRAIEFLAHHDRDRPFLLRVSHNWPHTPVLPPRPWDELYDPDELPIRYYDAEAVAGRSAADRQAAAAHRMADLTRDQMRQIWKDYFGLCSYVDHEIGRLLAAVDRLGLRENTIIVFNADHGRMLGEFGTGEKGVFDDQSWRVPLIFSWPGHLPEGQVRDDLCELIDFGPTLMNLAGLEDGPVDDFRGRARGRDLFDASQPAPQAVFGQIHMPDSGAPLFRRIFGDKGHGPMRVGVRTPRHRLDLTYMAGGRRLACDDGNLIDMQDDPGERRNLFHDPAHRPTRDHLLGLIDAWFAGLDKPAELFADTSSTPAGTSGGR